MTNQERASIHTTENLLHSILLVAAMIGLLAVVGWIVWGPQGIPMLLIAGTLLLLLNPSVSPQLVLRMYRARPLTLAEAPGLVSMVHDLARRAGLPVMPRVFYVPSHVCNAFALGSRSSPYVAVTDCLLRRLGARELAGVLAHEISHIRSNDLRVMGLADMLSRGTRVLSLIGQLLLVINLPLMMTGRLVVPWMAILVLLIAPTVAALLQLALSRARELDADVGAARLTGDPRGLASALARLEQLRGGLLTRILLPERGNPEPSLLRTHPVTEERVRRLLRLAGEERPRPAPLRAAALDPGLRLPVFPRTRLVPPRWRMSGLWY
jgi:heat shock protein HtpX